MQVIMSGSNSCSDDDHIYGYVETPLEAERLVKALNKKGHKYGDKFFWSGLNKLSGIDDPEFKDWLK